jgi:hypothetical protein
MRPSPWTPGIELTKREETLLKRFKSRPLYGFLRRHRHRLFDEGFQAELAEMYPEDTEAGGRPPVSPAMLAMVTLLQAYTGLSDADAVDEAIDSLRWRLVLGLLETPEDGKAPFSQGALVSFRNRLIAAGLDRRLLERTVELARETGDFGYKNLRLALDASPLFTAGRVEDAFNLLGHAARNVLVDAAALFGLEVEAIAYAAGIPLLAANPTKAGGSLKARLDVEWERPEARAEAFDRLVNQVLALKQYLEAHTSLVDGPLAPRWKVVEEILGQDVEPDPLAGPGPYRVKPGTAAERRPSVEDGDARHGRKTRQQKFVGYKRHLALDLTSGLVLAAALAPANKPEGTITEAVAGDLVRYIAPGAEDPMVTVAAQLASVHVDRAYLSSALVRQVREAGGAVYCKPFPQRGRPGMFTKAAFKLSLANCTLTCPAGAVTTAYPGETSHFPAATCRICPLRAQCTSSSKGRSVSIHPDEAFFEELRARQRTPEGRLALRHRVKVEHALAREVQVQGRKARYRGTRKNQMAVRLGASIVNLHTLANLETKKAAAA